MKTRTRRVVAACCLAVAVATVVGLLVHRPGRKRNIWAEAPFADQLTVASAPRLADEHEEFRQWLVRLVANPDEDLSDRYKGVDIMLEMKNGPAVYDMVRYVLADLEGEPPQTSEQRYARATVGNNLMTVALLADWPIPQALEVAQAVTPRWRTVLEAQAAPELRASNWPPERAERMRARARELLAYADSAVHTSAPPQAAPQPQPEPAEPPAAGQ
jgi:hypothetical protein